MIIVEETSGTTSNLLTFALYGFQKKMERKGQRIYLKK